ISRKPKSTFVSLGALRARATERKTLPKPCFPSNQKWARLTCRGFPATGALRALFDVIDDVAHGLQFLRVLVRHFDGKFFFESHHQFHDVERISSEIFDERRLRRDLLRIHAELLDDDVFDFFLDRFVSHKTLVVWRATVNPATAAPQVKQSRIFTAFGRHNALVLFAHWRREQLWRTRLLISTNWSI